MSEREKDNHSEDGGDTSSEIAERRIPISFRFVVLSLVSVFSSDQINFPVAGDFIAFKFIRLILK